MSARTSFDSKSLDLAEHFLSNESANDSDKRALAGEIQQAVEDWFAHRDMLRESAEQFRDRRAALSIEGDASDFTIMRWAQRNPRVCCSNHPTGEPIIFGGRWQP